MQHEEERAKPFLRVPMVKGDLVRGQADLFPAVHYLQLNGDKLPANPQGDEAVGDTQIYPGLNPGNKAVWEVFF